MSYLLSDAYRDASLTPRKDDLGVVRIIPYDALTGLTVSIAIGQGKRYGISTHIPQFPTSGI